MGQGVRSSLYELRYRLVKRVLTEYFQFLPCHFSFYYSIYFVIFDFNYISISLDFY